MNVTTLERDNNITLVVLTGRLDTTGVEEIRERLSEAVGAANQSAIIDLSQIDFVGSSGLGLLVANRKRLMQTGHQLMLLNPTEMVEMVLKATRLDQILPIAYNLDEAIQKLEGVSSSSVTDHPPVSISEREPDQKHSKLAASAATVAECELKLSIENKLAELPGLNATLAKFLREHDVPQRAAYAVNVVIDELVVNVIRYAYVDDDTHLIDIEISIEGEQVILRIADDGRPFDPRKGPELDPHAEDGEIAALGLLLVLELIDVLKYRRMEDVNRVEVRIHCFAEAEHNGPSSTPGAHSDVS
jgi:anti-anti-sigma factor